jgi:adhesin HecA-like repeat protein
MSMLDFQLGKVEKLNSDGTIHIRDFRTGGQVYQNVAIEHNAINQQQPVEGQHVLFFTTGQGSQHLVKVVRLYGSVDADQQLVLSSPIDLDQGEGCMISQTGATVYVANGGLYFGSCGQSITLLDEDQLMEVLCRNLNIVTNDGFSIKKDVDSKLVIQKGTASYDSSTDAQTVTDPTVVITIQDGRASIVGKMASVTLDLNSGKVSITATEIDLNGTTPVARKDDSVKVTIPAGTQLMSVSGSVGSPIITDVPIDVTGIITSGSSTVKSG